MPATTTENAQHFALDGPIGLPVGVVVAVASLLLLGWSLWKERGVLGVRYAALFWCLRAIALGVAIMLLLAPTQVLVETSSTRKSIAIVTDVSGSMQTIDPPGTADDVRWAISGSEDQEFLATATADRAVAAAGLAEKHLIRAAQAIREHQSESRVVDETTTAQQAIESTRSHLSMLRQSSAQRLEPTAATGKRPLTVRLVEELQGPEFQAFSELCSALKRGRMPAEKGWRESLPDLRHRLSSIRRQLTELARDAAVKEAELLRVAQPERLAEIQKAPRLARAAGFVQMLHRAVLAPLQETADVRLSIFDQELSGMPISESPQRDLNAHLPMADQDLDELRRKAAAAGTNLTAVLEQLNRSRRDQPLAATFILTDVSHNKPTGPNPRELAAEMEGSPVYVVPIGNTQHVRDVILQSVFCPTVAMRNDDIVIEAVLQAYECEGATCVVQLLQDGQPLDSRTVHLDSDFSTRRIRFDQKTSEIGTQQFEVVVSPVSNELTDQNNTKNFQVNVTRSDIKLLLSDEMPRWEYRYLTNLFRRDPKVECDEMLFHPRQIATGRRSESGTFPVTADDWDQYDVVILGDLAAEHFPALSQETLIQYLEERGGTLVLIAGRESMPEAFATSPLADILPVTRISNDRARDGDQGYTFHVTQKGRDHNALMIGETDEATGIAWDFVNRFSPLHDISPWRLPRPSATTLISAIPRGTLDPDYAAKSNAFLCWQPIGRGRVVYLSGPDTYRLRHLRGDRLHYRFWGQLLRWAIAADLSPGTEVVRIRSDRNRYQAGEPIRVTVRLTDADGIPVVASVLQAVARRGDEEHNLPLVADEEIPGEYVGDFQSLPPGVYALEPAGEVVTSLLNSVDQQLTPTSFTVRAEVPVEYLDTRCDRALAQQIADFTGGQVLPPTAVEEILKLTNLEPEVTQRVQTVPLWLQWKYLWIVFGCLQTEWIVRKWKGLS